MAIQNSGTPKIPKNAGHYWGGGVPQFWIFSPDTFISIYMYTDIWVFPKIGVPQNGRFIMENTIKINDLGVPQFLETTI